MAHTDRSKPVVLADAYSFLVKAFQVSGRNMVYTYDQFREKDGITITELCIQKHKLRHIIDTIYNIGNRASMAIPRCLTVVYKYLKWHIKILENTLIAHQHMERKTIRIVGSVSKKNTNGAKVVLQFSLS